MIDLSSEHLSLVQQLLAREVPECEVRAFGSRVVGGAKPYSDLDLVLMGTSRLPLARLAAVREAFEESELPMRVEVVDWHGLSEQFRSSISGQSTLVYRPAVDSSEAMKRMP